MAPAKLSIVIAMLVPIVFIWVDQAAEVLRCLAENQVSDAATPWGQVSFFIAALFAVCIHGWYFTRVLFKSPCVYEESPLPSADKLRRHLPRILGVIPAFGLAAAFWSGKDAYGDGASERRMMNLDALVCCAIAVVLWLFFHARRRWLESPKRKERFPFFHKWGTRLAVMTMVVATTLTVVGIIVIPVGFPQFVGTGAILLFAAASLICYGCIITYFSYRWKVPWIGVLLVLAAVFSQWNDNHKVRTLKSPPAARIDPTVHFKSWFANLETRYPGEKKHPVFIVAAEGGGIRAAYWTATVLSALQDANSDFGSHVYAISGVSGGSLGGAVFTALLADGVRSNATSEAQAILSRDFLSPTLGAMLFPDFIQRFLPVRSERLDRARSLEMAWEAGWQEVRKNDRFAQPFTSLWQADPYLPSLFLNGTSVEFGQRLITSNLRVTNFLDSMDAYDWLDGELRLSTAAHMSARFTYVSPAGRFTNGQHVVDGGYFENSGATTADDIAGVFDAGITNLEVFVILISNSSTVTSLNKTGSKRHDFLSEVLAPIQSMLHTREARGSYAKQLVQSDTELVDGVIEFNLEPTDVPLPLGWQLSRGAAGEMNRQLGDPDNANSVKMILEKLSKARAGLVKR